MCAAFLPPCAPDFDGRVAVHRLVRRRNARIAALFAVKMRRFRRIAAAHLAKIAAHLAKKSAAILTIPALPAQIQRQTIKVWHALLSDCGAQYFTNYCIFFRRIPFVQCTWELLDLKQNKTTLLT